MNNRRAGIGAIIKSCIGPPWWAGTWGQSSLFCDNTSKVKSVIHPTVGLGPDANVSQKIKEMANIVKD